MKRAGIHIALLLAAYTLSLCVTISPPAESFPISGVEDHVVVPASGAKPLPQPPDVVVTGKRREIHRINSYPQGILSFDRLMPERRPLYYTPAYSIAPYIRYVFIPYLPRDPPTR